ncbi:ATP-binding protein [Streptomyces sp. NPDC000229]|uniref:ATP-binding protein n=1 Tax=Streptomyces sp. NPDC000229 TaxID=3154247 RepID=UPI00332EBB8E
MTTTFQRCIDLDGGTVAAARAREFTARFMNDAEQARGHPASRAATDAVLLVASELVTNAVRHTAGPCTLCLAAYEGGVLVEVRDTSAEPPQPRTPDITGARGGWGWALITRLADDVSVLPAPDGGKAVRTRLPW